MFSSKRDVSAAIKHVTLKESSEGSRRIGIEFTVPVTSMVVGILPEPVRAAVILVEQSGTAENNAVGPIPFKKLSFEAVNLEVYELPAKSRGKSDPDLVIAGSATIHSVTVGSGEGNTPILRFIASCNFDRDVWLVAGRMCFTDVTIKCREAQVKITDEAEKEEGEAPEEQQELSAQ